MLDPLPDQVVCHACWSEVERNDDLETTDDGCYIGHYECDCGAEGAIHYDPAAAAVTERDGEVFGAPQERLRADGGVQPDDATDIDDVLPDPSEQTVVEARSCRTTHDLADRLLSQTPSPGAGSATYQGGEWP